MAASLESIRETATRIANQVVAPRADENDKRGRFPSEAVAALGQEGLLGLCVPESAGGLGQGPRAFAAVVETLAQRDASTAMIFVMHTCAQRVIAAANKTDVLRDIAAGRHLSTLAFSEAGSRSHFWAPVSRAVRDGDAASLTARKSWVTSAGQAQSYVVTTLSPDGESPTDSTLYLVRAGVPGLSLAGAWDGLGLRANASAPMALASVRVPADDRLTDEGKGFQAKLEVVLPFFNLGCAAMSLGLCRAALSSTTRHLASARFEHLGQSLGEALPTVRAQLAEMHVRTDGLAAHLEANLAHLERPSDATVPSVLSIKAAAAEHAIAVTDLAMRACGGAAFSRRVGVERPFRDARASSVMAPTTAVLHELIGRALLGLPLF